MLQPLHWLSHNNSVSTAIAGCRLDVCLVQSRCSTGITQLPGRLVSWDSLLFFFISCNLKNFISCSRQAQLLQERTRTTGQDPSHGITLHPTPLPCLFWVPAQSILKWETRGVVEGGKALCVLPKPCSIDLSGKKEGACRNTTEPGSSSRSERKARQTSTSKA